MEKTCEECGLPVFGRADKRFCCDHCRNGWHNKQGRTHVQLMRSINNILKKNRNILAELNPDGKRKIHRDELAKKGFNLNYFTNVYATKKGSTYYYCYDQGYLPMSNQYYMLVERKGYVD